MNEDDVPPRERNWDGPSFAGSLGAIFGAMVWALLFFGFVFAILYAIRGWMP